MDTQRWNVLQEAFNHLATMPPDDQAQALADLQEDDPAIANEVRELLEEDASNQQLPEMNIEQLLRGASHRDEPPAPGQGQIGPYRIIKLLGEGGMGVVYLAERTDIAGPVAVKVLRDAWLSPSRRQRFAIEQQMLGLLHHPSIARIYDAGTTKDGTPWFVMEFSDGVPITEYLRKRSPTVREIMKLVGTVCETVRYAHSLAIIHRDLKPSNILVTDHGQVKLLDFGIAKQMSDLVDRGSTFTTSGFRLFTPAYAAPEVQSENRVGVFTDIYSMGVILYELITGALPFSDGVQVDRDAQRPSKGNTSADSTNSLSLSRSEWADIDAICMKALDKHAENRYRSMDAFIDDISAFLEDRPLQARRSTFLYTAKKFLLRNRLPVFSVTCAILIMIAGTLVFTIRLAKARNAATLARDQAVMEASHSARLQRFTESMFTGGANKGIPPPGIKVTQMLDRGRLEALQITGDPQLQADMLQSLGYAYFSLGHFAEAEPLLRKAQQQICGAGASLQCADIEVPLGEVIGKRGSLQESQRLIQDALQIKQGKLPASDVSIARIMIELGEKDVNAGDMEQAKSLFTQALSIASAYGHPTSELADALDNMSQFGLQYNDPRGLEYEERSAQIDQQLFGRNSYEYATREASIGNFWIRAGKYRKAEDYYRSALADVIAWTGENEEVTARWIMQLGFTLNMEGKFPEARDMLLRALAITSSGTTPSSLELAGTYFDLGYAELHQGNLKAAERYFGSVLSLAHQHYAVDEMSLEYSELGLAEISEKRGDYRRAEPMIRQVLSTTKLLQGYLGVAGHALLGDALLHEGEPAAAEVELRQAYEWFSHDRAIRPQTVQTYRDLSEAKRRLGRSKEGAKILAELRAHPK